jgi:hypothetical protein
LPAREYQLVVTNLNEPGGPVQSPTPGTFALYHSRSACFYDFFESGSGKWERSGEWAIVTLPDGEPAMTDSPTGPYKGAGHYGKAITHTTYITSQPFYLTDCISPVLTFRHDYVIAHVGQSQDVARVEISINDGDWIELEQYTGGGPYGLGVQGLELAEWTNVEWKDVEIRLNDYVSGTIVTGTSRLRFSLEVDEYISDIGWVIDDVRVWSVSYIYLPLILKGEYGTPVLP